MKYLESFLILIETELNIWKFSNLVSQFTKICYVSDWYFSKNARSKTPSCSIFPSFHRNQKNSYTWYYIALSIIRDLVDQNLLRIEWENRICKLSHGKNRTRLVTTLSFLPKNNSYIVLNICRYSFMKTVFRNIRMHVAIPYFLLPWMIVTLFLYISKVWVHPDLFLFWKRHNFWRLVSFSTYK